MKKKIRITIIALATLVLVVWGFYMLTTTQCERDKNKWRKGAVVQTVVPESCMISNSNVAAQNNTKD